MGLCPIFTAVLERVVAAGRLTGRWLAVTAVAVAGCVALVLDGDSTQGPRFCLGIAAAVTSALAYSAFTVAGAKVIGAGHPSTAVMAVVFCGTALGLTPAFLIWPVGWMATPAGASVALFLGLVATTGAYVLFGFGLRHVPARAAATLVLAEPATAATVAVAVLGERLGWLGSTGLLAVFAALVAMVLPNSSSSRATSRPTARHRCETARRPVPAGVTAAQAQTLAGMITAATMHQDAQGMLDDIAAFLHAAARTAEFGPSQDADPAHLWARIEARTR
jgi:DME family drug/metabolite transporter